MLRWWDGAAWTEHRRPAQDASNQQPTQQAPSGAGRVSSGPDGSGAGYVAGSEYGGRVQFGSTPTPASEPQQHQYGQQQGQ